MTRQEAIRRAAQDVAEAADYSSVGQVDFFGQTVTADQIADRVRAAIDRLARVLAETDAEWDAKWSASDSEERRVEDEAWKFAAGK